MEDGDCKISLFPHGSHVESHSTMFGTALTYCTLRILGLPPTDPRVERARQFIHQHGGAGSIPSWGKFWLATLGVYDWEGMNPLPPELWLLPRWLPFHPGRFWCHCRMVYLAMSYLYGRRTTARSTPLLTALKEELYPQRYSSIRWGAQRWNCCALDISWLRKKALNHVAEHLLVEDESTQYVCIGPVNKTLNMLSVWDQEGSESPRFLRHLDRMWDYLWQGTDGLKMQGYNGAQLWDTAFALQALLEAGGAPTEVLLRGHHYLEVTQVREDVPNGPKFYRHISKGAWPFSTRDHGWPISDCTAEGLKAALGLRRLDFITPLETYRYEEAVNVMLSLQNADGGWPTYELQRGPAWVEKLNPSEVFYDIMVDYSYVECTSACVQALCAFRQNFPSHRSQEINRAIDRGVQFIKGCQRPDGSWKGSWGVCFTYGIWFGVQGLVAAGEVPERCPEIQKACHFLLDKQKPDGGWGETFLSCVNQEWSEHEESQTVNTAWATLVLLAANWEREPIDRAVKNLMSKQLPNGDWKLESVSGVFNANCAISYNSYKNTFPIWALGRYANKYL